MRAKNDEISMLKTRIMELENSMLKKQEFNKIFEKKYIKRKHKLLNKKTEICSLKNDISILESNEKKLKNKLYFFDF